MPPSAMVACTPSSCVVDKMSHPFFSGFSWLFHCRMRKSAMHKDIQHESCLQKGTACCENINWGWERRQSWLLAMPGAPMGQLGGVLSTVSPVPWLFLSPGPWGLSACSCRWLWRLRDRPGAYPVLSAHTAPPPRISLSSFHLFRATVIIFGFSGFS